MRGVKGGTHQHSEETKKKIGLANRGVWIKFNCDYCGEEKEEKQSHYNRKKKHYCNRQCYSNDRKHNWKSEEHSAWKGGISDENQRGRGGTEYKKWMKAVREKSKGICKLCENKAEECHHIKGWTEYPELRYNIDNGVALCRKCHYSVHYENPELLNKE